jgi:hypothetical protein
MAGGLAQTSWRWAFYFNLPICGITFVLLFIFLDVHNPRTKTLDGLKAIDWTGSIIVIGMTVMVLLGLQFGGTTFPWGSPKVIVLIVVGSLLSLVFIYVEKKLAKYPIMPLGLFHDPSNVAVLVVTLCHGIFFIGGEYFIPFYLQSSKAASPLKSGVLVLPLVLMEAVGGITSGIIMHQTGRFRETIWTGMVLSTIGLGLFITLTPESSIIKIIGFQLITGLGAGGAFTTLMIAIQARVSQADVATATSTLGFVRNIACSIGIVIGGAVISNGMENQRTTLALAGLNQTALDMFASQDSATNVLAISSITDLHEQYLVKEAYSNSLQNVWMMYLAFAGVGLVSSLFIRKAILSREHIETKTGIQ